MLLLLQLIVLALLLPSRCHATTIYRKPDDVHRPAGPPRAPFERQVLVIVDSLNIKSSHSIFFSTLEAHGFSLTFQKVDDPQLKLFHFGDPLYSSVVLFAPTATNFAGGVSVETFLEFIDGGHNLILAASSALSEHTREIAEECGALFDAWGTHVIDHMSFSSSLDNGDHVAVIADSPYYQHQQQQHRHPQHQRDDLQVIVGKCQGPVVFRGVAHMIDASSAGNDRPLNVPLVTGSRTCYSANVDSGRRRVPGGNNSGNSSSTYNVPFTFGRQTTLLSALQARNNARVIISGSLDFYSDEFMRHYHFDEEKQQRRQVCNYDVGVNSALWALQTRGVIKAMGGASHAPADGQPATTVGGYRVGQNITYQIRLLQRDDRLSRNNGTTTVASWRPYIAEDVYLDVAMLDPYVRVRLQPDAGGNYRIAQLRLPDVPGVFQLRVDYGHRTGYSRVFQRDIVAVRPLRHDEFPRFIGSAYPYYASALSMMFGVVCISCVFLFHREEEKKEAAR